MRNDLLLQVSQIHILEYLLSFTTEKTVSKFMRYLRYLD